MQEWGSNRVDTVRSPNLGFALPVLPRRAAAARLCGDGHTSIPPPLLCSTRSPPHGSLRPPSRTSARAHPSAVPVPQPSTRSPDCDPGERVHAAR